MHAIIHHAFMYVIIFTLLLAGEWWYSYNIERRGSYLSRSVCKSCTIYLLCRHLSIYRYHLLRVLLTVATILLYCCVFDIIQQGSVTKKDVRRGNNNCYLLLLHCYSQYFCSLTQVNQPTFFLFLVTESSSTLPISPHSTKTIFL